MKNKTSKKNKKEVNKLNNSLIIQKHYNMEISKELMEYPPQKNEVR